MPAPLGRVVDTARLKGTLIGPRPDAWTREALTHWREHGGALAIDRLKLTWGDVRVRGDGRLALDAQLRPQGKLTLRVQGVEESIDAFQDTGAISTRMAGLARMGAAVLEQLHAPDDARGIKLPVRFQQGRVRLGPAKLWRLDPVLADRTSPPDAPR